MTSRKSQKSVVSQVHVDDGLGGPANTKRLVEETNNKDCPPRKKRTAFGDITNATVNKRENKKDGKTTKKVTKKSTKVKQSSQEVSMEILESSQESRSSQGSFSSTQSSPATVLSDSVDDLNLKNDFLSEECKKQDQDESSSKLAWEDIDQENMGDPSHVALYAHDIFKYYKEREKKFVIRDYMVEQKDLTCNMRAILVDWLVEVQENFELNHETLYLAVKMVDHYLANVDVTRDKLQLIGASAMFVAAKFDERCPPVIEDFMYVCDDAYKREEFIRMEMKVLKSMEFDIGLPLSYRYVRRYAKCGRCTIETLTLSRYVLEMSLMDYTFVSESDALLGAAALLLAMRMKGNGEWNDTLIYYSGFRVEDLMPLVSRLNLMIASPPYKQLSTIKSKYSHPVFHQVAKIAALDVSKLVQS